MVPGAEGKEKETERHWTIGASMAQERGATSGNLKTVSLSTCAAKLFALKQTRPITSDRGGGKKGYVGRKGKRKR